jgi:hypothetical protein
LPAHNLFFEAFEDQHVRVDRHADREHEAGDAGQRQHGVTPASSPSSIST